MTYLEGTLARNMVTQLPAVKVLLKNIQLIAKTMCNYEKKNWRLGVYILKETYKETWFPYQGVL